MTSVGLSITAAVLATPVVVATLVFAWHALRSTDPGPAGKLLLQLVRIIMHSDHRSES
jgi:hypothetical protein